MTIVIRQCRTRSGEPQKSRTKGLPDSVGAATGIVGAAGGLGGFFPPLVMGVVKDATGEFVLGFVFLACFALVCAGLIAPLVKAQRQVVPDGA